LQHFSRTVKTPNPPNIMQKNKQRAGRNIVTINKTKIEQNPFNLKCVKPINSHINPPKIA
jgi:hypothetical protein